MTIATDSHTSETIQTYKWTIDQYHLAIEAGLFEDQHLELLNGELVLMPSEGATHAGRGGGVAAYLRSLVGNYDSSQWFRTRTRFSDC
jgi:Uma2 family endonuclease